MSQTNDSSKQSGAKAMRDLRIKVLTSKADAIGIKPTEDHPRVFTVLMDWPLGTNTVSVFGSCTGDASVYTTSTFGIIGGIGHETVRNAAQQFVKIAEIHCDDGVIVKDYPYPPANRIYFYLVCFDGVRLIDVDSIALRDKGSKYYDLGIAAQHVITELRKLTEK